MMASDTKDRVLVVLALHGGNDGLNSPSLKPEDLEDGGDLLHTVDFRGVYATMLESLLELDSKPIVGGAFERLDFH